MNAVSVILAVRNGAELVERQLVALLTQREIADYEVCVVVNGSTDATLKICRSISSKFPRLRIIDLPDSTGKENALNVGVRTSTAELFATADHDDIVSQYWLSGIVETLRGYDVVGGSTSLQSEPLTALDHGNLEYSHGLEKHGGFLPYASGSNLGFARRVFDHLGGFDPSMKGAEDIDFCWRAQLAGFTLGFASDARVVKGVRSDARQRFQQHRAYGRAEVALAQRYASFGYRGLLARTAKQALWLARHIMDTRTSSKRSPWCAAAGRVSGVSLAAPRLLRRGMGDMQTPRREPR